MMSYSGHHTSMRGRDSSVYLGILCVLSMIVIEVAHVI